MRTRIYARTSTHDHLPRTLTALLAAGVAAGFLAPAAASAAARPDSGAVVASAGTSSALAAAYAAHDHIPVSDVAGVRAGSLHTAAVGGTEWATASFTPAHTASAVAQAGFQDGGSIGVFTRVGTAPWTMLGVGGEPFPCGSLVPTAVRSAWGLATAACTGTAATGGLSLAATSPRTGTPASVASIAAGQVGRGDTPVSTDWNLDCDAYTTLVGVGVSSSGCGTDPNFHVRDQKEFWCADFAKWVWEQAGVKADLSVLNAGATSFATWAKDEGESTALDKGTPAVGDAIVFYPPATTVGPGSYADHVGIIIGVDSAKGTVEMANGDFLGSTNITVQNSGYVKLQSFANAVWATGEKWVLVAPKF
jgi:hypothetical protein